MVESVLSGDRELRRKFQALGQVGQGKAMLQALISGALIVQNGAKQRVPYLTGNLRRSIHIGGREDLNPERGNITQQAGSPVPAPEVKRADAAVYVGTNVEYAARREFGFSGADRLGRVYSDPAQPYLRPALDEQRKEIYAEIADALRDLVKAAAR